MSKPKDDKDEEFAPGLTEAEKEIVRQARKAVPRSGEAASAEPTTSGTDAGPGERHHG